MTHRTSLLAIVVFVGLFGLAPPAQAVEVDWPATTRLSKPWTRWWWHGSAATPADLTAQMEKYAAAGIGGLEITPIYGVRGGEMDFVDFLSPQWVELLEHVLREAERLDMGVDMATGSGWPFGGPWVESDAACRNLVLQTYKLSGGQTLDEPIRHVQRPLVRAIGRRVAIGDLRQPLRDTPNLQQLALEQVRYEEPLPLAALVAYGEDGSTVDLMQRVDSEGKLDWQAPDGKWTLYAVFLGWHGKLVERAGAGGEGNVLDHFSRPALDAYLKKFDDALTGREIGPLRAFFNDSYEVDDAAGNADGTPRLFEEFARRRGYDLRGHLPALSGKDSPDANARVLCDYRETLSDLILEEFTKPWDAWAAGHEAQTRNQAHGSPSNLLDLYAASDIPECEGTDRIAFLTAASAAHVAGKPLVSAEACTWLDEHFLGTLAEAKRWVDGYFLGGVNHVCYHGTCFSPDGEPWPGRLFYASVELQPTNPQWVHFHALNEYVARCQAFLQAGNPDSDVLVYLPIHDEWAKRGRTTLTHFNGEFRGSAVRKCAEELLAAGYSFDFISDRQLHDVDVIDDLVSPSGPVHARAIVVPPCETIPLSSLEKLVELAEDGAQIVVASADWSPDVPGLADLDARRQKLQQVLERIRSAAVRVGDLSLWSRVGAGGFSLPSAAGQPRWWDLLNSASPPETMTQQGLAFVRRRHDDGLAYFIVNQNPNEFDDWVSVRRCATAMLFDPLSGDAGVATVRAGSIGGEVRLQLASGQACIVRTYDTAVEGVPFPYVKSAGEPQPLAGPWRVTFLDGGPTRPAPVEAPIAKSWTEFDGDDVKSFSGVARYAVEFNRPASNDNASVDAWLLDLGIVRESAAVRLNGEHLATVFTAPFRVRIPGDKLKDRNTLEIDVANLMANRIADLDRRGVEWARFYNINMSPRRPENRGRGGVFSAAQWQPTPSGLVGPLTLTPINVAAGD